MILTNAKKKSSLFRVLMLQNPDSLLIHAVHRGTRIEMPGFSSHFISQTHQA